MPATVLGGRYELGAKIGRGGMAEVRLGHDLLLDRTVAVKILHDDLACDPVLEARFRREAQIAGGLDHPSIVTVLDTGEQERPDGTRLSYIVMEYVQGRTLRQLLGEGIPPVAETLRITDWVLAALEVAHRAGVVHRDIKPANIMVTDAGAVVVMDFGIARALDSTMTTLTQTDSVVGTAQYMAPEQARAEKIDTRADLYAVGCVLFELLTGRPPFVSESVVALLYQHMHDRPPVPSALDPAVPPALDRVVARALAKDRDARYQTATEMRADLRACWDGLPTASRGALTLAARPGARPDQSGSPPSWDSTADLAPPATAHWSTGYGPPAPPPGAAPAGRKAGKVVAGAVLGLAVLLALELAGVLWIHRDTGSPMAASTGTPCWDGTTTGDCPPFAGDQALRYAFTLPGRFTCQPWSSEPGVRLDYVDYCTWAGGNPAEVELELFADVDAATAYWTLFADSTDTWADADDHTIGTIFRSDGWNDAYCYDAVPACLKIRSGDEVLGLGTLSPDQIQQVATWLGTHPAPDPTKNETPTP